MMPLEELTVLYLIIGAGCAAAVLVKFGPSRDRLVDAAVLIPLWPLYGPFLFMHAPAATAPRDQTIIEALQRADGTPLAVLLPDPGTAQLLHDRLTAAERKVHEIDQLLKQPDFSEAAAAARAQELEERGDTLAASMAHSRVQNIRRLQQLRDRFTRELTEVGELFAQLRVQAELVRLAGADTASSRDLTAMIVARVEGLGAILDEDSQAVRAAT